MHAIGFFPFPTLWPLGRNRRGRPRLVPPVRTVNTFTFYTCAQTHFVHLVLVAHERFEHTVERRIEHRKGEVRSAENATCVTVNVGRKPLHSIRLRNIRICSVIVFCALASHTAISCRQTGFSDRHNIHRQGVLHVAPGAHWVIFACREMINRGPF